MPDFVGELLDTIGSFVDGTVESLGKVESAVTPGGEDSGPPVAAGPDGGGIRQ